MSALSPILHSLGDRPADAPSNILAFWCPGCGATHAVAVGQQPAGHAWGWNSDVQKPTFTPSILAKGNKQCMEKDGSWTGEWERDAQGNPVPYVCHSFVTDGRIQFLGDCTHALAGQTVDLPEMPAGALS